MKNHVRILAAKTAFTVAFAASVFTIPAQAGIPVADGLNLSQNILTALESVAQTLTQIDQYATQIEEYQTQLEQYENQLLHSLAPVASIWDKASSVMDKLVAAQNTLSYYENKLGSLERYLDKYQDVSFYKNSPCFTAAGCSDAEMKALQANRHMASESQKKTNDDLFKVIKEQQKTLKSDARTLEQLQRAAQGAEGQLQAIGYANQLASNQTTQLMQIRSLLLAQQSADASRHASEIDAEARGEARAAQMREWKFKKSPADDF